MRKVATQGFGAATGACLSLAVEERRCAAGAIQDFNVFTATLADRRVLSRRRHRP